MSHIAYLTLLCSAVNCYMPSTPARVFLYEVPISAIRELNKTFVGKRKVLNIKNVYVYTSFSRIQRGHKDIKHSVDKMFIGKISIVK